MNGQGNKGVGYFRNQPNGCYWYRVQRPMQALASAGVKTVPVTINEDMSIDELNAFHLYGAYPFSFQPALVKLKTEYGKKLVYDMDDASTLIEEVNPFYLDIRKNIGSMKELVSFADEITVSTPVMADYVKTLEPNKKITVVPNCYTPSEWLFPRPRREGLRIGFTGSSTHVTDLIPILPTIKKLQDKYKFTFILYGFDKVGYNNWFKNHRFVSTEKGQKELEIFDKLLSEITFEFVPFTDFDVYPGTLTNIALDIGLCPLTPTPFNDCRSASKAMEYTLSGALAIASNSPAYTQDPTSIIAHNWEEALEYFITHPEEIQPIQQQHLSWIQKNRNIDTIVPLLKEIYDIPV